MNRLLQLSGRIQSKPNPYPGIPIPKFRNNTTISIEKVRAFEHSISEALNNHKMFKLTGGALLSIEYEDVIAKSNRMRCLFKLKSSDNMNDHIRGSKFSGNGQFKAHVFTYFFQKAALLNSLERLSKVASILIDLYDGQINSEDYKKLKATYDSEKMSRSEFTQIVADLSYIKNIYVDTSFTADQKASIISFFGTNVPTKNILETIGLKNVELINDVSAYLRPEDLAKIQSEIPYLVSMNVRDITEICPTHSESSLDQSQYFIEDPKNDEPIVGVIDTLFDNSVYFKNWVDYKELVQKISTNSNQSDFDTEHGTLISSIIVDGPRLNPWLEDDCGRFRVRHFGVTLGSSYSSFEIIKHIENIIKTNRDIKVWNFSLGSESESNINFISPEAALLDRLQTEYDVIFIVSGTNDNEKSKKKRIGSPADSLNSLVVNSVRKDNSDVSYARSGPVLSFFRKPDLSYYGGDENEKITTYGPKGKSKTYGTSFAAAWITRKVAFLIYKMGFSKELAKALLIDASASWTSVPSDSLGYGVPPKKISEIIEARDDEIRFVVTEISKEYETFSYDLPVPVDENKHPFLARATLCYFPPCSRYQGVDYTCTELDLHFGRLVPDKQGRIHIQSLDHNLQGTFGKHNLTEDTVRAQFRKWDNVKIVRDTLKSRSIGKKSHGKGLWGISLKSKERLSTRKENNLPFALVVTLKEVNGKNRNTEFVKLCAYYGWIVEQIDINNRIDIFNQASEEIVLY